MDFQQLLKFAVQHDASDIHIQAGLPPNLRIGGLLKATSVPPVTDSDLHEFIGSISPARLKDHLDDRLSAGLDFSYGLPGLSRFRCSAYRQLGEAGISMRVIKSKIRSSEELHLPPVVNDVALSGRGLTLVTGTT